MANEKEHSNLKIEAKHSFASKPLYFTLCGGLGYGQYYF
jgi:hypothetical protein